MRLTVATLLLYGLFLVQANLSMWAPDLMLLALVAFALHEERLAATLLGLFCGLCLDLTSPTFAGANMLALAGLAWVAATLRDLLYRSNWSATLLVLAGLVLKWGVLALSGSVRLMPLPLVVSSGLTIMLSPLVARLLAGLFYPRWKTA